MVQVNGFTHPEEAVLPGGIIFPKEMPHRLQMVFSEATTLDAQRFLKFIDAKPGDTAVILRTGNSRKFELMLGVALPGNTIQGSQGSLVTVCKFTGAGPDAKMDILATSNPSMFTITIQESTQ
jgi:hypothetical protein